MSDPFMSVMGTISYESLLSEDSGNRSMTSTSSICRRHSYLSSTSRIRHVAPNLLYGIRELIIDVALSGPGAQDEQEGLGRMSSPGSVYPSSGPDRLLPLQDPLSNHIEPNLRDRDAPGTSGRACQLLQSRSIKQIVNLLLKREPTTGEARMGISLDRSPAQPRARTRTLDARPLSVDVGHSDREQARGFAPDARVPQCFTPAYTIRRARGPGIELGSCRKRRVETPKEDVEATPGRRGGDFGRPVGRLVGRSAIPLRHRGQELLQLGSWELESLTRGGWRVAAFHPGLAQLAHGVAIQCVDLRCILAARYQAEARQETQSKSTSTSPACHAEDGEAVL
ncbi:hypothetical protein C8Q74DRAFT_1436687 [Fomes fomentarius]|nr:hypothetical protein C8Q74DRAFT_1436687 [Fomes fomentarius]